VVVQSCRTFVPAVRYVPFLDFKAEQAQGLWGIEGQEQPLWSRHSGDSAAPPGARVIHRVGIYPEASSRKANY